MKSQILCRNQKGDTSQCLMGVRREIFMKEVVQWGRIGSGGE